MARTLIFYHGNCPDGFGGAYSAWKKFGDTAEYHPLHYGKPEPTDLVGSDVYFIDFCYEASSMERIKNEAASLTVLDHHQGTRAVVESMPHFVFDENRSGATIAWSYFHPDVPTPRLLSFVEDGDLFRFVQPDTRAALSYIYAQPFTFESWDALRGELESDAGFARIVETGTTYRAYFSILAKQVADSAELVSFEGHTVYMISTLRAFTSEVGRLLYSKQPPFAMLVAARPDGIRVSLRGDTSVDLSKIAQKYGGNGHPGSAAFSLLWGEPIPWKVIEKNETPRD